MTPFSFRCSKCDKLHEGIPSFSFEAPMYYYDVPEEQRATRTLLTSDTCVIDDQFFFAKGYLEIPVQGLDEPLTFTPWVSLSQTNFGLFETSLAEPDAAKYGQMFGWFSSQIDGFGDCRSLKTDLILQDNNYRPLIEIEPTEHPLSVAHHQGISHQRLIQIVETYLHRWEQNDE
jgi:hypothetical protein